MRIEYITNASVLLHLANGKRILVDPWYTDGIYLGTLFNFPPLTPHQRTRYLGCRPDYIYISHFHGDHLDPATLAHFSRDTPILIGRFPTASLRSAIRGCGFSDIRELPFREPATLEGCRVVIYPQFAAASEDAGMDDYSPVDTSILVLDDSGARVFFAVDNPMRTEDAAEVRKTYGPPDAALLPYSGASIYPWAFRMYSAEEKAQRAAAVRRARLAKFCDLGLAIGARYVVPAAGTFVYGGRLASQARYQLHASPEEISQFCDVRGMGSSLRIMASGDVLDVGSGELRQSPDSLLRNFSEQDRLRYATQLADVPCPLDSVRLPSELHVPWIALLKRARANLWQYQQTSGLVFPWDVEFSVRSTPNVPMRGDGLRARMPLDRDEVVIAPEATDRSYMRFHLDGALLLSVLVGAVFWNVAEYFMEIERNPDVHNIRIHQLLGHLRV